MIVIDYPLKGSGLSIGKQLLDISTVGLERMTGPFIEYMRGPLTRSLCGTSQFYPVLDKVDAKCRDITESHVSFVRFMATVK